MVRTIAIVGGGIVGLNIALELSSRGGSEIFLLEREPYLGHHTSTRNSEVIHAGFAYPPGSQKARLCVEGNRLTFELARSLGVAFRRDGKWIVASDGREAKALSRMMENARLCGVPGMREANPGEVVAAIPQVKRPMAAAFSASSGIVDAAGLIRAIDVELSKRSGVTVVTSCGVDGIDARAKAITTSRGEMNYDLLVNAAGLFADEIYRMAGGQRPFEIRPFKGEYCTWRRGELQGLLYPVPHRFLCDGDDAKISSMGIHAHRSVAGELFVGPTEVALSPDEKTDYSISTPKEVFAAALSALVEEPPAADELAPAFAGNRPKLFESGRPRGDFEIFRDGDVVHLMGIESPGLTSAPAIARLVCGLLD